MKDFIGQDLMVGDHVAYSIYDSPTLTSGYVIGFSGKDFVKIISELDNKLQSKEGIMYTNNLKTEDEYENWLNSYPYRRESIDCKENEPYPIYTFKKKNTSIVKII